MLPKACIKIVGHRAIYNVFAIAVVHDTSDHISLFGHIYYKAILVWGLVSTPNTA